MSRPTPPRRPAAGSRTPTPRPRRVAGQSRAREGAPRESAEPLESAAPVEPVESVEPVASQNTRPQPEPAVAPKQATPGPPVRRRRLLLLVAVAILLAVGVGEVRYLQRSDPSVEPVQAVVPVQVSQDEWLAVVAQSATAATTILSASSESADAYDAHVEAATKLMTEPFAEQFRTTKADVKQQFLAAKTKVSIDITGQGVVSATPQEITTLLFLTQSTTKDGTGLTAVQFQVTVTMLKAGDVWLVGDLQAN